jgi:fatty acid desaturase
MTPPARAEWPTLALLVACYALWALAVTVLASAVLPAGIALAAITIALHASLQHEAIHGHPTGSPSFNEALVWPALGLLIPYGRFRDIHLAHHRDATLTDPYEDPETNYLDPAVWVRLPGLVRALLRVNNTLLGRILLGPLLAQVAFVHGDLRAVRAGDRAVARAWRAHILPAAAVVALVAIAPMPLWAYALAIYAGHGLVKIRTFLEHQAHEHAGGRTVVIEDRGPLALLFLNNNFHLVHHMHPGVPWYRLPALYFGNAERYLRRNRGYRYRSYAEIIVRHLLRAKDPVPHPLWPQQEAPDAPAKAAWTPLSGGAQALGEAALATVEARPTQPGRP